MRSFLQEPVAQKLPDASEVWIDKKHYYRQFLHGYYQFNCTVKENIVRSAKFYIPEGSVYNQPTIFLGIPERWNSWDFMVKSGWKALSDKYGLYLILMEPDENGWSNREEDVEYLDALNNDISLRPLFCSFQANFYVAAYGAAADVVGIQSRSNPRAYAAAALIGTKGMTEEEEEKMKNTSSRVSGVMLNQIQWPIWLSFNEINRETDRLISYYRNANHSEEEAEDISNVRCWKPVKGGTLDEHWCANVYADCRIWENCVEYEYSKRILEELFDGIYRYPGDNNGALRKKANIFDRGFRKFSADVWGGYYPDKKDIYRREWYVYVPGSAPKNKKIPVVFVFHGAGGSGDEIADRMGWSDVADKYGFMIVMPTASEPNQVREISDIRTNNVFRAMWNTGAPQPERPADMMFLDFLYAWVLEHYPVDPERVYGSGQSSGGMMSWACAAYRPDYFAAVAPFSARHIDIEAVERGEQEKMPKESSMIPIMANLGCCDAAFKGGFTEAKRLVNYWCERYGLTKKWEDYTYMGQGDKKSFKDGFLTHYIFKTSKEVPMLYLTETDTKAHATWPSECELVWQEFFTKFKKNENTKTLYYRGQAVEQV